MAVTLAILASLLQLSAYVMYSRRTLSGGVRPNLATWTIWGAVVLLNASSYLVMTSDWVKSLLPLANSLACIVTCALIVTRGKWSELSLEDRLALAISAVAIGVWWASGSAATTNLILQLSVFIGFLPTYRGVLADPAREQPAPWLLWTAGYGLAAVVVLLRWSGRPEELVYPGLCAVWHAAVALLALRPVPARNA